MWHRCAVETTKRRLEIKLAERILLEILNWVGGLLGAPVKSYTISCDFVQNQLAALTGGPGCRRSSLFYSKEQKWATK